METHTKIIAKFWHTTSEGKIQCELCPHQCKLVEGYAGRCRVRAVHNGKLIATGYGNVSSIAVDPIEKKPLYHFFPGSRIFSIGGWGCNFRCVFCQNFSISQDVMVSSKLVEPSDIIQAVLSHKLNSIAFTYNEPLINFEFVLDTAILAKKNKILTVLVTNGFIEETPAKELLPYIDAMNVDIKSMEDEFYRKYCYGRLMPVLDFCKLARKFNCHIEITNLIIPELNDRIELFVELAEWIRDNLGQETPLHFSAYRPAYKLSTPATPAKILEEAYEKCRTILPFIYLGNIFTDYGQNTVCPECGSIIIARQGYSVSIRELKNGGCANCGRNCGILS